MNDQQIITSEAVAAWMKQQLEIALKTTNYASLSIGISAFRESVNPTALFRIYPGDARDGFEGPSFSKCFADMDKFNPKSAAQKKREQAASLLAEAEKLESETI